MTRPLHSTLAAALVAVLAVACAPATPGAPAPAPGDGARPLPPPSYPTSAPEPGPAPGLTLTEPVERTLANGLRVIYMPRPQLPMVQAVLVTRGGTMDDPASLPGLASFTASMLTEGAGGRGSLELAEAVEQLGASLRAGAAWDAAQVNLRVLKAQLPEALRLMADVTIRPDFPEADLARVRSQRLTDLSRARDEPGAIAGNAFASLVYGHEHPYGRLSTTESVARLDRDAVADFHRRHYRPGVSTLVLAGDVDEGTHRLVEQAFAQWQAGPVPQALVPAPPTMEATRVAIVDRPGAAQSEIRIGHPGAERGTEDFYALQVLNTLLGGSFTSRLMQNLRETHGYTYGAGSSFALRRGVGPFTASAAVVTAKTDSALIQFFHELDRIRDAPVPADELERAKTYVALRLPQQLETSAQLAGQVADLAVHGLPPTHLEEFVPGIMQVTAADVQRVARQYIRPDRAIVVVVGDRAVIEEGIRALPFATVEIREVAEFVR
jgi:zinc protease